MLNSLGECETVSIRIVADCGALSFHVTRKLKRATTPEIIAISAMFYIQHKFTISYI